MEQLHVTGITITSARFISSSAAPSRKRQATNSNSAGDSLVLTGTIQTSCTTDACDETTSESFQIDLKANADITLLITLSNGMQVDASATFASYTDTSTGKRFVTLFKIK
jgi:hypothetical protein